MSTLADCDKLCLYNVIPRTTTKKSVQRDILKNTIDESKLKYNFFLLTHNKKENETQTWKQRAMRKQKIN